jgi:predicted metal-dependent HD superfamily phosphohydrolase
MKPIEHLASLAPHSCPQGLRDAVESAYAEPPRAYHNLRHLVEMGESFRLVERELGWQEPGEVFAALLFHDAIYVAGAHDNETRSAELAVRVFAAEKPSGALDLARVAELIRLTALHGRLVPADVDRDAQLFLDCDMAILAAAVPRFEEYERAIFEEYSAVVSPEAFAIGRRAFLRRVLALPQIFLSPFFLARLEAPARRNLERALGRS